MRNRILIGMGTSLLDGAGRVCPGSTLGTIEALSEQANAQTLHDHPDTDPSQLLALNTNLLPSVFWDKDQTSLKLPNPDGATSFFVNLAEPDAMSQVVQLLQTNGGIAPQWLVDTQGQLCIWSAPNAKTSAMHKTMTRSCWHQSRQKKVARKFDRLGLNKNV